MIGWSGRVDIDGNTYQFLHSGQGNNDGHYSNPAVDKLLDEARGLTDLAKRRDLYAQMWPICARICRSPICGMHATSSPCRRS